MGRIARLEEQDEQRVRKKERQPGWDHLKEPKCDGVSGTWMKVTANCVGDPWTSDRRVGESGLCFSARSDLVRVLALTDHSGYTWPLSKKGRCILKYNQFPERRGEVVGGQLIKSTK